MKIHDKINAEVYAHLGKTIIDLIAARVEIEELKSQSRDKGVPENTNQPQGATT